MANKIYLAQQSELNNCLPKIGGTMTGNINMNNNQIAQLATPVSNNDAVTKQYVDDAISSNSNIEITPLSDMDGSLVMLTTTINEKYKKIDLFSSKDLNFYMKKIDNTLYYLSTHYSVTDFKSHFNYATTYYPYAENYPICIHAYNDGFGDSTGKDITYVYQEIFTSRLYNDNLWFSFMQHYIYGQSDLTADQIYTDIPKGTILHSCIAINTHV